MDLKELFKKNLVWIIGVCFFVFSMWLNQGYIPRDEHEADLSSKQEEILDLQGKIHELELTKAANQVKLEQANENIDEVNENIDEVNEKIDALQDTIDEIETGLETQTELFSKIIDKVWGGENNDN